MGAGGHDRALGHAVAVERLDVAPGQDLVDVLVAHPAGRIAGARLLLAQDREADPGGVEAAGEGAGDLPVALVKGRRTADPVQDLDLVELAGGGQVGRRSGPRSRGPWSSPSGSSGPGPTGCRPSPCSGRRRSARPGSVNPRGPGCAGSRRSCRRARSGPDRLQRTRRRSRSPTRRHTESRDRRSPWRASRGWASCRRSRPARG